MNYYLPNFTDPRVISRIKKALGFTFAVLSETKPRQWSTRYLDKYLGSQSNDLGKFLRDQLLICTKEYWSREDHICKEYRLNRLGWDYLAAQINHHKRPKLKTRQLKETITRNNSKLFDRAVVTTWVKQEFGTDLESKDFKYEDKANRLWHPLQSVKKEFKREILKDANLNHQYDVVACAPTLLMNYALSLNGGECFDAIENYIRNRTTIRKQLAKQYGVDEKTIKIVINALFCGARLGCNRSFALSHVLDHNRSIIIGLKNEPFIVQLKADIRRMWKAIEPTLPRRVITTKNGHVRRLPVSSKDKWAVYFQLERSVLNSAKNYFDQKLIDYFLEHDGWSTSQKLDISDLTDHVFKETNLLVQLDYEDLAANQSQRLTTAISFEVLREHAKTAKNHFKHAVTNINHVKNSSLLFPIVVQVCSSTLQLPTPATRVPKQRSRIPIFSIEPDFYDDLSDEILW